MILTSAQLLRFFSESPDTLPIPLFQCHATAKMRGCLSYAAASSETILFCDYVVVVDGEDRLIQAAASPVHLSTAAMTR
jgi:hypothetical protein